MLKCFISLASVLYRARAFLWVLGAAGAGAFLAGITLAEVGDPVSLAGLIGLIWSAFLIALTYFFAHRQLTSPIAGTTIYARARHRIGRAMAWIVAIMLIALAVFLSLFTFRVVATEFFG